MRALSAPALAAVRSGARMRIEVTSWLGSRSLGPVPVVGGSWTVMDSADEVVPGRLEFDCPAVDWLIPTAPDHPLAAFGQRLRARVGVPHSGIVEWVPVGQYRLASPGQSDGDVIHVQAEGLLSVVERDRLTAPTRTTGTRAASVAALLDGVLPVIVKAADKPLSPLLVERDRLDGIRQIVEGWPARVYVDAAGTVIIAAPWDDTTAPDPVAVLQLTGVPELIPSEAGGFNAYVVSTVPEGDAEPVTEVVYLVGGPMAWGGAYGRVPGFYASPVLPADRPTLRKVGQAMLDRAGRRVDSYRWAALPDPSIEIGDPVGLVSVPAAVDGVARVTAWQLRETELTGVASWLGGVR